MNRGLVVRKAGRERERGNGKVVVDNMRACCWGQGITSGGVVCVTPGLCDTVAIDHHYANTPVMVEARQGVDTGLTSK
jgi:hypothetical protein